MATRSAVVVHDPMFLTLLQEAISADGYEVRRLFVGIGAHEIVRDVHPAAPLLDIPRDDPALNWRLLGIVRDDLAPDPIHRVVCITRDQVRGQVAPSRVILQGHDAAILTKPFALDDLLHLVHRMVGGPDRDHVVSLDPTHRQECSIRASPRRG